MNSWGELGEQVRERAEGRCEYCRMHQVLQGATFHVEHIVPRSHGGATELDNLAWACPGCNLCKSDRTEGRDPLTNAAVALFNPRADTWSDHFRWVGYRLMGQTSVGRATIQLLQLNHPRRVLIRQAEALLGLFRRKTRRATRDWCDGGRRPESDGDYGESATVALHETDYLTLSNVGCEPLTAYAD
jgi:hypothetical protein